MDLGLPEIVVVLLVVLLLFGPSKVPQLGESLGKAIRGFRDAMNGRTERPDEAGAARKTGAAPSLPPAQTRAVSGMPQDDARPSEPVPPDRIHRSL
jgi:sec-independent protein translocase protein TatA